MDIRTCGAICDGLTDDTAAVNLALTRLPSTGGLIWHSGGTCLINSTVDLTAVGVPTANIHFAGPGTGAAKYKFGVAGTLSGAYGGSTVFFSFSGLTFSGTNATTPAAMLQFTNMFVVDFVNCSFQDAAVLLTLNSCGHIHFAPTCTYNFNQAGTQRAIHLSNSVDVQIFGSFEGHTGGTAELVEMFGTCDTVTITANAREEHSHLVRFAAAATCNNITIENCNTLNEVNGLVLVANTGTVTDCIVANNTALGNGTASIAIDFSNPGSGTGVIVTGNRMNNFGGSVPVNMGGTTSSFLDHYGVGSPVNNIAAPRSSIWHRADGGAASCLWVQEAAVSTSTGWVNK